MMKDDNTPAIYWSVVECDIGIICVCMPSIPMLLKNIAPSIFGVPSSKKYSSVTPQRRGDDADDSGPRNRAPKDPRWHMISESEIDLVDMTDSRSDARVPA